ncbi:DUF2812 domain-containing protein [Vagococcus vulneris]|uniref:DUF2812 domain-containing protein n=1 Tax=Vagococcus vulneris TaxID=1977869 RepID=A0A429ZWX2_9ENTE|nr:DUF2812 domain-containing protein [Vagococcus vulneris]RST98137.1 hypothetical protein CBF37_08880 [Vagococcus vulneris]
MKRKIRYFASIDREERWLNKQLTKGLLLVGPVGDGIYKFKETSLSTDKVIRIDCRSFKNKEARQDYLQFMDDSGWEYIRGYEKEGRQYFISQKQQHDELFSDIESKLERQIRVRNTIGTTNVSLLLVYFILFKDSFVQFIKNPSSIFLTQDLWAMPHNLMIKAILFELPFALLRLAAYLVFPTVLIILLTNFIVAQRSINQLKQKI